MCVCREESVCYVFVVCVCVLTARRQGWAYHEGVLFPRQRDLARRYSALACAAGSIPALCNLALIEEEEDVRLAHTQHIHTHPHTEDTTQPTHNALNTGTHATHTFGAAQLNVPARRTRGRR